MHKIDSLDRSLIAALQKNSQRSLTELAETVALSPSACHRRIKQLEAEGIIQGYSAQIDGKKIGYTIEFFVEVSLDSQKRDSMKDFEDAVRLLPEVLECHLITGQADYIMRIAAADPTDYEKFHRAQISKLPGVSRVQSSLVLRTVSRTSGYAV